jgi:o-succinylbenzoate synthase
MALKYTATQHILPYNKPATTSRGSLSDRKLWIISVEDSEEPQKIGYGECGIIPGLSPEDYDGFDKVLANQLSHLNEGLPIEKEVLFKHPALSFAIETALLDLQNGGKKLFFDTPYAKGNAGIYINGLVWMDSIAEMEKEAIAKMEAGFDCLKFKIGAHDFDSECRLLEKIRKHPLGKHLEIRTDANGAFAPEDALFYLKELNRFSLHSIEQPIKPGQWDWMEEICSKSPLPIALDEELILRDPIQEGKQLLKKTRAHYIILKPSLLGGLKQSDVWIEIAEKNEVKWWATSALESNIGLNAIAQWVAAKPLYLAQGLGTGQLYQHNFEPETKIEKGKLYCNV